MRKKWRRRSPSGAIPHQRPELVPIAVDRPVKAPVKVPVAIAITAPAITHHRAMVHTGRLEPVAEAAGLGGLHERHPSNRRGHYRSKNKPHEDTSSAGYSRENTWRETGNLTRSWECRWISLLSTGTLD